jgi:hypothetical protein
VITSRVVIGRISPHGIGKLKLEISPELKISLVQKVVRRASASVRRVSRGRSVPPEIARLKQSARRWMIRRGMWRNLKSSQRRARIVSTI